jgi:hypothetical protein
MEPLSIFTIGAAVGGVAGKLTEKAWDSGEKWLSKYFEDHNPKAIEKAKQNSLQFLADLAYRVNQLEEVAKDDEHIRERILTAMEDPDFSAILKDSLLISARTDQQDTHKILARMVSERLHCESGELLALTIPLTCEAVKALTGAQMRFLATKIVVEELLPKHVPAGGPPMVHQRALVWLEQKLSAILPENEVTHTDLVHMECLSSNWNDKLSHITPTSIGQLIGICVYDELTDDETDIKSIFPS